MQFSDRSSTSFVPARLVCIWAFVLGFTGCWRAPEPRSRDEVFRERMKLPALFLGEKSGEQLIASGDRGKLVGPDGKEIYWRAMECLNPNCPGRSDDKPFLFPEPDGISYIKPDGTIGHDVARLKTAAPSVGCPMCWPLRSRNETEQQRQQYANWVQPYVLPETAKRLAELDEEIKLRTELDKRKRHDAR